MWKKRLGAIVSCYYNVIIMCFGIFLKAQFCTIVVYTYIYHKCVRNYRPLTFKRQSLNFKSKRKPCCLKPDSKMNMLTKMTDMECEFKFPSKSTHKNLGVFCCKRSMTASWTANLAGQDMNRTRRSSSKMLNFKTGEVLSLVSCPSKCIKVSS